MQCDNVKCIYNFFLVKIKNIKLQFFIFIFIFNTSNYINKIIITNNYLKYLRQIITFFNIQLFFTLNSIPTCFETWEGSIFILNNARYKPENYWNLPTTKIWVYVEFAKSNNILARFCWSLLRTYAKAYQS